jgi:plasmid maintenance system antidote protein VapI
MGRMDMSSRVAVMLSEQLGTLSEQLHALQAEVELRMLQTARAVLQHNALL